MPHSVHRTFGLILAAITVSFILAVATYADEWRLLAGYPGSNAVESYDGITGSRIGSFPTVQATGIAYHAGILYITSYSAGRIYKYNTSGAQLGYIAASGPCGIDIDISGYIYVAEDQASRVVKLNPDGSFNSVFASGLSAPRGLCLGGGGVVYVACFGNGSVRRFTPSGAEITPALARATNPMSVAWGPDGFLYVGVTNGGNALRKVHVSDGTSTTAYSVPAYDLEVGPDGNLYIADLFGNRVGRYNILRGKYDAFSQPTGPGQCSALGFYPVGPPQIRFSGWARGSDDALFYSGQTVTVDAIISNNRNSSEQINIVYSILDYHKDVITTIPKQINIAASERLVDSISVSTGKSGIFKVMASYSTPSGLSGTEDVAIFGVLPYSSSQGEGLDDTASALGLHSRLNDTPEAQRNMSIARKTRFKWVRILDFDLTTWWHVVEPVNNQFTYIEDTINTARQSGLSVVGMLFSTPRWASSDPTGSTDYYVYRNYPATNIEDFRDYVTNVVNHYKDRIKYWEVWNEADMNMFWMGAPEDYARYVKVAYEAAKAADPQCTILAGGALPWVSKSWAERACAAGLLNYTDILSFHGYPDTGLLDSPYIPAVGESGFANGRFTSRFDFMKDLMSSYGAVRPMWNTETALWGSTFYSKLPVAGLPPVEQWRNEAPSWAASEMVKLMSVSLANGAEKVFYYVLGDNWPESAHYPQLLCEYDGAPTSRLIASSVWSYLLSDVQFFGSAELGPTVYAHVFAKNGGSVAVLWSEAQGGRTVRLAGSPTSFVRKDTMGNCVPLPDLTLYLTQEPFYLISDSVGAVELLSLLNADTGSAEIEGGVVVATNNGTTSIRSGTDLAELATRIGGTSPVIAIRPDDDIVTGGSDGLVSLLSGSDLTQLAVRSIGGAVSNVAVQPDGDVVVSRSDGWTYLLSGTNLSQLASFNPVRPVLRLAVQPDGDVVLSRDDGRTLLLNGASLGQIASFTPGLTVTQLAVQLDGDVIIARSDGRTFILSGSDLRQIAYFDASLQVTLLALQPDGDVLACRTDGWLFLLSGTNLAEKARTFMGYPATAMSVQSDGTAVVVRNDGVLFRLRADNLQNITYTGGYGTVTGIVVQTDGDIVAANNTGRVWIADGTTLYPIARHDTSSSIAGLAMQRQVARTQSVLDAKRKSDGEAVTCSGIVTASFPDFFYIEKPDRSSGIRISKINHNAVVESQATIWGTLATLPSEERYIAAGTVSFEAALTGSPVQPLGMSLRSLGGGGFCYSQGSPVSGQVGVIGASGLNNIGILVRTAGRVIEKGPSQSPTWFVIDDGSGVGAKVVGNAPAGQPFVTVTGISSCEKDAYGDIQRLILATAVEVAAVD